MYYNETTTKGNLVKEKITESRFYRNLKTQIEEHPMEAIMIGAIAATAAAKLMESNNNRRNSKSWEKEVDRRRMNTLLMK